MVALGSLYGGAAVLDAKTGAVMALSGIAFSAPQPPGSTFKIITATALSTPASSRPPISSRSSHRTPTSVARSPTPTTSCAAAASSRASPNRATPSSPRSEPSWAATSSSRPPSALASTRDPISSTRRQLRRFAHRRARSRRISTTTPSPPANRPSVRARCWPRHWRWRASLRRSQTAASGCRRRSRADRSSHPMPSRSR